MSEPQIDIEQGAALALLEDTVSGIDFGIALVDEDLNFVMFNETYIELAFGPGNTPKIGDSVASFSRAQLACGFYVLPDGVAPEHMSDALIAALKACETDIMLERSDGRWLEVSAKRTKFGGYLVAVKDVTDREKAKDAENTRWQALAAAFDAMEEGVSLWDADFRFVMANDTYMKMIIPYRDSPWEPGTAAQDIIAEAYQSGIYDLPEATTEADFIAVYMDWASNHAGPFETLSLIHI